MSEGAGNAQSHTERRATAEASSLQRASAPTSPPSIDDETAAALTLYNAYLIADREQQTHERAIKKAEKAKNDAAAAVRKLNERKASASETAAAEARYRDAVEALRRLQDGASASREDSGNSADDSKGGATGDESGDEVPADQEAADTADRSDDEPPADTGQA